MWTGVWKEDGKQVFGNPDNNMKLLSRLNEEFEKHGHAVEFISVDGVEMEANVRAVKQFEYRQLCSKTSRTTARHRSDAQNRDMVSWPEAREVFLSKYENDDVLKVCRTPGARFVDYLVVAFGFTKEQIPQLLALFNADACFRK